MPCRDRKRSTSKYVTAFDVQVAKSYLRGMKSLGSNDYGIAMLIRFNEKNGIKSIRDVNYHVFSCSDGLVRDFDGEGIISEDEFARKFALQLKLSNPSEALINVGFYDMDSVDDPDDLLQMRPDSSYSWNMIHFYVGQQTLFPVKQPILPPGIYFVDGKIMQDANLLASPEENETDPEHFGASGRLLESIVEYTHPGGHLLGAFWEEDTEQCSPAELFVMKKPEGSLTLVFPQYMTGTMKYNMMLENMEHCIDEERKFHVIMQSIIDVSDMDCDIEVRAWEVKGSSVTALDDHSLKSLIDTKYSAFFVNRNFIFCDSWDYPVSRIDPYSLTLEQ